MPLTDAILLHATKDSAVAPLEVMGCRSLPHLSVKV